MLDIAALQRAFIFRPKDTPLHRAHPTLKLAGTALMFTAMLLADMPILIIILAICIAEAQIGGILRDVFFFLRATARFLTVLAILLFLLYMPPRAISILLRVLSGTLMIYVFVATTNPSNLAQALEDLGIPELITMAGQLAIRVIPLMLKDAVDATEALTLRGVLGRGPLRGLIDLLAVIVASAEKRRMFLEEAMKAKFFGVSKRTYLDPLTITKYSVAQLLVKTVILVASLCF